ncbi:RHS repeat-associated core domain-containing protein, partial [Escherichia coli]|uniref:RHS repeat-associated core domain-containing protein n=1 Tax=Escherichia coli TaxID=562 RepID=UPI0033155405
LQQLIRLPGQQYDEESGLYYNRHRYYDPLQGRYITQDPIGLKGGWNLYGYQLNPR